VLDVTYRKAFRKIGLIETNAMSRHAGLIKIRKIDAAEAGLELVRELWSEYWESQALAPDFQGFAEERRTLPGLYAPPHGRLLLATVDGVPAGTGAFRPLRDHACEAKRLFVRPQFRGFGVAKALLATLIEEARAAGHREMFGDTLGSMQSALRLYEQVGFQQVGPYSPYPTPEAIYLRLLL
jgi:GNAT superfamily N-acetyltransferase